MTKLLSKLVSLKTLGPKKPGQVMGDLATLMEVFYFSREPNCLAVLRWVAMLPEDERCRLAEFGKSAQEGDALRVESSDPARLLLTLVRR